MPKLHVLSMLVALSLPVLGCESKSATAIDSSGYQVLPIEVSGAVDPSDPYACALDPDEFVTFDNVWPFQCTAAASDCSGWGGGGQCDADSCDLSPFHTYCDGYYCESDADCPAPKSGNVTPTCQVNAHACQLACTADSECPVGMTCQSTEDWGVYIESGPVAAPFMCLQTVEVVVVPAQP